MIMTSIKDKVKEKIKQYSNDEYLDGYIKNEFLTDDGDADILLHINSKDELFDSKTSDNQLDLKNDIYEYIDNKTSMLNNDIKLNLKIVSSKLNKNDEEKVKHIINEHYAIELYKIEKKYKRYKNIIFRLVLSGLLFLSTYALITFNFSSKFFIEIFGFLFSFTLWKALETFIYTLNEIKYERESITQKLIMEIVFDNKNS